MKSRSPIRSVKDVVDLLGNPQFIAEARRIVDEAAALRAEGSVGAKEFAVKIAAAAQTFQAAWGVLPPTSPELLDAPDPRRRAVEALASGNWGVVMVFPRTSDREVRARVTKIRASIRHQHKDALNPRTVQLERWLDACGCRFGHEAIARTVRGRTTGLRRPTTAQAIKNAERKDKQLETRLLREYQQGYVDQGFPATEARRLAERRVYRRLRGSEAPAQAAMRMAGKRYGAQLEDLNTNLAAPVESEGLSAALTCLFRGIDEDDDAIRRYAIHVRAAFDRDAGARTSDQRSESVLGSGRCGVILVLPWTTSTDIRRTATAIRSRISAGGHRRGASDDSSTLATALGDLFRAMDGDSDAAVTHYALTLRNSFRDASRP